MSATGGGEVVGFATGGGVGWGVEWQQQVVGWWFLHHKVGVLGKGIAQ